MSSLYIPQKPTEEAMRMQKYFQKRKFNNKASSKSRPFQVIPIFKEVTISHEWEDKAGNLHNKGMTSTRKVQVSSRRVSISSKSKQFKRK